MNRTITEKHLRELSYGYCLDVDDEFRFFILRKFNLPSGYNRATIDIWTEIPTDYPESAPGVGGSFVYVPEGLKFHGRTPNDYHQGIGRRGWAWWCYESIDWDPCRDDLISFFEIVRAHMTDPD